MQDLVVLRLGLARQVFARTLHRVGKHLGEFLRDDVVIARRVDPLVRRAVRVVVAEGHRAQLHDRVERVRDGLDVGLDAAIGVGEPRPGRGLGGVAFDFQRVAGGGAHDADPVSKADRVQGQAAGAGDVDIEIGGIADAIGRHAKIGGGVEAPALSEEHEVGVLAEASGEIADDETVGTERNVGAGVEQGTLCVDLELVGGQGLGAGVESERAIVVRGKAPAARIGEHAGPVRLVVAAAHERSARAFVVEPDAAAGIAGVLASGTDAQPSAEVEGLQPVVLGGGGDAVEKRESTRLGVLHEGAVAVAQVDAGILVAATDPGHVRIGVATALGMYREVDRGHRLGGGIQRHAARRVDEHGAIIGKAEVATHRRARIAIQRPGARAGGIHFRQRLRIAQRHVVFTRTRLAHRHFHPAGAVDVFRQVDLDAEAASAQLHPGQFGGFTEGFHIARVGETAHAQIVGAFGRRIAVDQIAVIGVVRGVRAQWQRKSGSKGKNQWTRRHVELPAVGMTGLGRETTFRREH